MDFSEYMDFSEWSPTRIIIATVFLVLASVGFIAIVMERVQKAVSYFRRKAQIEGITLRGVVRDWLYSTGGPHLTIFLLITLLMVGLGYVFLGKDLFNKEDPGAQGFMIGLGVIWALMLTSFGRMEVAEQINKVNQQISEMNQRLSDMDYAIRQLKRESDSNRYGKGG